MPVKLTLPNRVLTNKEGYQYIASLFKVASENKNDTIVLDFQACQTFDANLAAVLGVVTDFYFFQGGTFFAQNMSSGVRKALARNGFLRVLQPEATLAEKENYVKYTRFKKESADEFKAFIDEWVIGKQKFPKHTKLAGEKICETLYELYVNAITHGNSDFVYTCGEYFTSKGNKLCITIVDMGITIPTNVNTFLNKKEQNTLDSCEAIKWAFVSGNTTKSTTGGLGLALLQDFIRQNEGMMQMVSADGMLEYRKGQINTYLLDNSFPGTIVNLEFNCDDRKNYYMTSEISKLTDLL